MLILSTRLSLVRRKSSLRVEKMWHLSGEISSRGSLAAYPSLGASCSELLNDFLMSSSFESYWLICKIDSINDCENPWTLMMSAFLRSLLSST